MYGLLQNRPYHAAVSVQSGAVSCRRKRATHQRHQRGNFFRIGKNVSGAMWGACGRRSLRSMVA